MRIAVVGLGNQGRKRLAVAGSDVVATVDPVNPEAQYQRIDDVPLKEYDAALVCTGDDAKFPILRYLLSHGKHLLVEKPVLHTDRQALEQLQALAENSGLVSYTAYNHRFEPLIIRLREELERGVAGQIYHARFFYGNGTARDVRESAWRDGATGVLQDLGSHLLDLVLYLMGPAPGAFREWQFNCFENKAYDHVIFGREAPPTLQLEASLLSWRNTFTIDIWGEQGSLHLDGLCKWGPSRLAVRRRVLPSGRPHEEVHTAEGADPTWAAEYAHFKALCAGGGRGNLANDIWINHTLQALAAHGVPS